MEKVVTWIDRRIKFRKFLTALLVGLFVIGVIFYYVKLPVSMAGLFVPFKVETPEYLPLNVENKYAKFAGFDKVEIIIENPNETLTVWATSDIGWNNVSEWDEKVTLFDGSTAYYNETDNIQMISWRINDVEYAVDYEGTKPLNKEELIKIASSIK
jgi:hypothetical protein